MSSILESSDTARQGGLSASSCQQPKRAPKRILYPFLSHRQRRDWYSDTSARCNNRTFSVLTARAGGLGMKSDGIISLDTRNKAKFVPILI
jgi:hypothetical protein